MNIHNNCCQEPNSNKKGFWQGALFGAFPHIPCLIFIIFSVLGVTIFTSVFRALLLNRYFFYILIGLSLVFATLSAVFYLRRHKAASRLGIKRKWKYLLTLYGTTIGINLLLFLVVFPLVANVNQNGQVLAQSNSVILQVDIPCSGHSSLIISELQKIKGVGTIYFSLPNRFEVKYDPQQTSVDQLLSAGIFKEYPAKTTK
ncbi:MAG: hypothetical protein PHV78_00370 [Patescibacteria group bacterium]|nr:hypothetical protein [Patescibacteria group bacterium]MDD5121373.1 hypothetical protein [Patescibacteria group bacterium]MDD5221780.1 hypothetical protein [Patescibacteria group bacterium]MDD5395708.1 hypothetical protein [Patescibacteria group bacterium]